MTFDIEDQKKQSLEVFTAALQAAPDSFLKALTGKEFANHVVEGAKVIQGYLYPPRSADDGQGKK
jgi:hypothetical protein